MDLEVATSWSIRQPLGMREVIGQYALRLNLTNDHTDDTWGEPSGIRVLRLANARLANKSWYRSGIVCGIIFSVFKGFRSVQ
jgi:hypothetical protein